jgi:hypothetical protein
MLFSWILTIFGWILTINRNIYDILQRLLGGFTHMNISRTNKVRGSIYVYIVRTIPFLCLQLQGWAKGLYRLGILGTDFVSASGRFLNVIAITRHLVHPYFCCLNGLNHSLVAFDSNCSRLSLSHPQLPQIILHNSYSFIFCCSHKYPFHIPFVPRNHPYKPTYHKLVRSLVNRT